MNTIFHEPYVRVQFTDNIDSRVIMKQMERTLFSDYGHETFHIGPVPARATHRPLRRSSDGFVAPSSANRKLSGCRKAPRMAKNHETNEQQ